MMRTLENKMRMELLVTHFQQWLFENRVKFIRKSPVRRWPWGRLVGAPALQVDVVQD